ncbi:MAG TPA: saccharopine dehydrogenase C-terminal domain-containing protein [Oculatellaceae cyanobacterium]
MSAQKKIVVIGGAGAMGQVIVRDLLENSNVDSIEIADFDKRRAEEMAAGLKSSKITGSFTDIRDQAVLAKTLDRATVVVNSTPYYNNVDVMKAALKANCHYMDLGGLFHVSRKQLELHNEFAKAGLIAILGMGAAPGLTNVMAASAALELDAIESIDVIVGCADFAVTDHPFLPPYAIETLLDEYCKEPMVFENNQYIAKPPMSGEIEVNLPAPVGKVHAIYTLHSEVLTLPITYESKMIKRTTFRLGLPLDFHNKLKFLSQLGFANAEEVKYSGGSFVPRKILAEMIKRIPSEAVDPDDAEVIRVDVTGSSQGKHKLIRHESLIYTDKIRKISCGALDTGVPPSVVTDMIVNGEIKGQGVLAPETCVPPKLLFERLAKRNIVVTKEEMVTESVFS